MREIMMAAEARVKNKYTMYDKEIDIGPHNHNWRVVDCCHTYDDQDICECSKCGKQEVFSCNFDDEYN
jgi:hypothetical protein